MSATAFQRRRRELAAKETKKVNQAKKDDENAKGKVKQGDQKGQKAQAKQKK